jgi:hypothetical protein
MITGQTKLDEDFSTLAREAFLQIKDIQDSATFVDADPTELCVLAIKRAMNEAAIAASKRVLEIYRKCYGRDADGDSR